MKHEEVSCITGWTVVCEKQAFPDSQIFGVLMRISVALVALTFIVFYFSSKPLDIHSILVLLNNLLIFYSVENDVEFAALISCLQ